MLVKVIAAFQDVESGVLHKVGDVFEASPERVARLNACGSEQNHVPLVEEIPDEEPVKPVKAGRKGGKR